MSQAWHKCLLPLPLQLQYFRVLKSLTELITLGQTGCIQGTDVFSWLGTDTGACVSPEVIFYQQNSAVQIAFRDEQTFCSDLVRTVNIDTCCLCVSAGSS